MRGEVGIPRGALNDGDREQLVKLLTRTAKPYRGQPYDVCALRDDDPETLWVPRYFQRGLWGRVEDWRWTNGKFHKFRLNVTLDPERGQQPVAVAAMSEHIRDQSSGILIAPTGTGKTTMGYAVAASFDRFIGVPVYVGHMMDNWVRHAKKVLGLTDDQIGIVQGDRCDLGRPVTIMMLQSLLARRYPDELYEQIGFLVCDEVHRYGAEVWKSAVGMFPAQYRLGLTATLKRKDGLDDLIRWSFGEIGHKAPRIRSDTVTAPTAYVYQFDRDYAYESYCNWKQTEEGWKPDDPNATKYDKQLAKDQVRNRVLAKEYATALKAGRQLLVLSSLVDHLETLRDLTWRFLEEMHPVERIVKNVPYDPDRKFVKLDALEAGQRPTVRERVSEADCVFATYQMARDALDMTKLDTLGLATPPGNVTQPIGRLREKADEDRRPLLVLDSAEAGFYSQNKLKSRLLQYEKLGIKVKVVTRSTRPK